MTDLHTYHFMPLDVTIHDRAAFACGNEPLDRYIREQARKEREHHVAAVWVLTHTSTPASIIGYYTLSSYTIDVSELPPQMAKRAPRYSLYRATLLGRLAVDRRYQGHGHGKGLLLDALFRTWQQSFVVGSIAIVVDAKDDAAREFYERYGFERFAAHPLRLFLPMNTIKKLFDKLP